LLLLEGLAVAAIGSIIGTLAGVGYAALMLWGLRTWWLPAIGTPFLTFHVAWQSPVIGFASGLVLALIAIWFAVRRIARTAPRACAQRRLAVGTHAQGVIVCRQTLHGILPALVRDQRTWAPTRPPGLTGKTSADRCAVCPPKSPTPALRRCRSPTVALRSKKSPTVALRSGPNQEGTGRHLRSIASSPATEGHPSRVGKGVFAE
jgi:hypothetical protein